jgi:hypothetical protein
MTVCGYTSRLPADVGRSDRRFEGCRTRMSAARKMRLLVAAPGGDADTEKKNVEGWASVSTTGKCFHAGPPPPAAIVCIRGVHMHAS